MNRERRRFFVALASSVAAPVYALVAQTDSASQKKTYKYR